MGTSPSDFPILRSELAIRVADASVLVLDHDAECHDYACLMREGCPERIVLFNALNDATNDYREASR